MTEIDQDTLRTLGEKFHTAKGAYASVSIRARDAGDLAAEARTDLRSMGFNLSFPNIKERRIVEGTGLWAAERLLELGVPFEYHIHSAGKDRPKSFEVLPGKPLGTRRFMSGLESIGHTLSPIQRAIVESDSAHDIDAATAENVSILAMKAREQHPEVVVANGSAYTFSPPFDPDQIGGFKPGGLDGTITYPDGHQVHGRLVPTDRVDDIRFLPNATIIQDPWRQDVRHYADYDPNHPRYADYIRAGSILMQPAPIGSNEKAQPIRWNDPRAIAYVDRETAGRLAWAGAPSNAMELHATGTFVGKVAFSNERWIALCDEHDNVTAHRCDDPEILGRVRDLVLNKRIGDEPALKVEYGRDGLIQIAEIAPEWKRQRTALDIAQNIARFERRGEWLRELSCGAIRPSDVESARALLVSEPADIAERAAMISANTSEELLQRERDAIRYVERGLSAISLFGLERAAKMSPNIMEDPVPFEARDLRYAVGEVGILWNTAPMSVHNTVKKFDRSNVIGTVVENELTGDLLLQDVNSGEFYLCAGTDLRPGECAWLKAEGTGRKVPDGYGDYDYKYDDLRTLAVYPIAKEHLAAAAQIVAESSQKRRDVAELPNRLVQFADLARAEKALTENTNVQVFTFVDDGIPKIEEVVANDAFQARRIYAADNYGEDDIEPTNPRAATAADVWRLANGQPERLHEHLNDFSITPSTLAR